MARRGKSHAEKKEFTVKCGERLGGENMCGEEVGGERPPHHLNYRTSQILAPFSKRSVFFAFLFVMLHQTGLILTDCQ